MNEYYEALGIQIGTIVVVVVVSIRGGTRSGVRFVYGRIFLSRR